MQAASEYSLHQQRLRTRIVDDLSWRNYEAIGLCEIARTGMWPRNSIHDVPPPPPPPYEAQPGRQRVSRPQHTFYPLLEHSSQCSSNAFTRSPGRTTVKINIHPLPHIGRSEQPWFGVMYIKCTDVLRLMQEGFFWDSSNDIPSEGSYESGVTSPSPQGKPGESIRGWNLRWRHVRHFVLLDRQHGQDEPPRWVAKLSIYAETLFTLTFLNLDVIAVGNIASIGAWDTEGKRIYDYQASQEEDNYNMMFGNQKLLAGWLPWPPSQRQEVGSGKSDNDGTTDRISTSGSGLARVFRKLKHTLQGNVRRVAQKTYNRYHGLG